MKCRSIGVCVTQAEHAKLKKISEDNGCSISYLLRVGMIATLKLTQAERVQVYKANKTI